jgi:hypothetical protein
MCTWKNSNSSSTNGGCEKRVRKFLKAWWFQLWNRGEKLFNINRKLQQRLHRLQNSSLCLPCSVPWASTYFQCTHITFCIQYDLPCVPTSIKVRTYWQRTGLFVVRRPSMSTRKYSTSSLVSLSKLTYHP